MPDECAHYVPSLCELLGTLQRKRQSLPLSRPTSHQTTILSSSCLGSERPSVGASATEGGAEPGSRGSGGGGRTLALSEWAPEEETEVLRHHAMRGAPSPQG